MSMHFETISYQQYVELDVDKRCELLEEFAAAYRGALDEAKEKGVQRIVFSPKGEVLYETDNMQEFLTSEELDELMQQRKEPVFSFGFGHITM